ncbi:50S ribosomal protein L10 [Desulfosarcina ovata subsp. sediminis]|uniref:Large ribosomal subunit protein uL10 n=1 Tax=Desulfosarcina ovata subsp. sediminis TaxID=885957 RepID=A0A5K7ZZF2_9BACT|nr:50S ribosomal protein L10 [Desulfosarcina ovata]BBO85534.1 50S ribosomal protein L10 [Desulfosarcina ovata subsp. sediminis]
MDINTKKQIASDLQARFEKAALVILTDYKGLNVESMNALRRKLREAGAEYQVVKNSLLVRASEGNDVALIKDHFKGPSAIALSSTDPVAPAKVLADFVKENKKFEIKVGVLNGKELDLEAIKALSTLPSREVMLAKVLSVMNAVPTSLVTALSDVPRRMLNVLQAIKDQKEAEA